MSMGQISAAVRMSLMVVLSSGLTVFWVVPAMAQTLNPASVAAAGEQEEAQRRSPVALSEVERSATSVADWMAQVEAARVQITDVRIERADAGLQVILETENGALQVPQTRTLGNALIVEIENAAIAQEFSQAEPIEGIALVEVTGLPGDRVRVAITGTDAPPTTQINSDAQQLSLNVTPGITANAGDDDAIQVVVTGEQNGYRVPNASVGTRTDTPLRDIPQSIQVIPQQVLEDQQVTRLSDAVRNAPGVVSGFTPQRSANVSFNIRGFNASENILINGFPDRTNEIVSFGSNIERVEILRGPASVLFGQGGLGGSVNLVTKQPLSEPFYRIDASLGNFSFYRGAIDLSGPLNSNRTVAYRLNVSAQTTESFIEFYEQQRYLIAPVLSWQLSDRTRLTLEAEFNQTEGTFDFGVPAVGSVLSSPNGEIDRDLFVSEPDRNNERNRAFRGSLNLEHQFSSAWRLQSLFRASTVDLRREVVFPTSLATDGRTLNRFYANPQTFNEDIYNFDTFVVGEFETGAIQHELVAGINLTRRDVDSAGTFFEIAPLDIFNPIYGVTPGDPAPLDFSTRGRVNQIGFYVQDRIDLSNEFILLLGGRFDISNVDFDDLLDPSLSDSSQTEAFSPRIGIVYQPTDSISLYASYARSFNQSTGASASLPEPERGTQYEIGARFNLSSSLSANLALYDLTRSNVPTTDLSNPLLTIQVGEQRSRGIEFDVSGEILPGWNLIAGYAYTNAEITEDNDFEVGNRLDNTPEHAINLWTTYEIQEGDLQGLGFGLGLFYYSDRPGDLANSFELPGYLRTDAAIFYRRNNLRLALNVRNLFDVEYFENARNRARVLSGDPLTVIGSISWEF